MLLVIAILLLAILQQSRFLVISGVNPNLVISGLAVIAFFAPSLLFYIFIAALGTLATKSVPGFESASAAILIAAVLFWVVRLAAPWRVSISASAAAAAGTAIFYAIVGYYFILGRPYLFAAEILYNIICAVILYLLIIFVYGEER